MSTDHGNRHAILSRIKEALKEEAPLKHPAERSAGGEPTTAHFREWLPPVGAGLDERFNLFEKLSESLRTELIVCSDAKDAALQISTLATAENWKTLALHRGELIDALTGFLPDSLTLLPLQSGYDKDSLEACDAGLTECELLVAQTGSVCVTSRNSGGRVLSVLPPHHLVVARKGQLVTDLTEAYVSLAAKYRDNYPSMISFITGPSRTGDIERILVLGAHGPKRLTVLLLP